MSISVNKKFLLILSILGIGVQTCTLHFPPEEVSLGSSNSGEEDPSSSSLQTGASSSSSSKVVSSSSNSNNKSSSSNKASSSSSGKNSSASNNGSSSSNLASSSSACTAKDNTSTEYCSGGTMKNYGSVTQGDKTYKTVEIGNQTWMAENLNYSFGNSRCYAEGKGNGGDTWLDPDKNAAEIKANCDKYGRLYDWTTAKTVCPSGWSLPDTSDWGELRRFIEKEIFDNWEDVDFGWDVATKLKATTGWKETATSDKGVDSYGFGAIGTGYCVSCESLSDGAGFYEGEKTEAQWWSATEAKDATQAYKIEITYVKKVMNQKAEKKADYLYSVRCIKK